MSRILLTWELGSNLGHLTRLLPLAARLKARGHSPLLVTRDLGLAAKVFAEVGIPIIQAPVATNAAGSNEPAQSYAEILWNQGWADPSQLWGMVQGWVNLLRMFRPHVAVLDHSPTALLAARATETPAVLIGTGFEIPPSDDPLPPFNLNHPARTRLLASEKRILDQANGVLIRMARPPMTALRELFDVERRFLTTFPELDHYGPRGPEVYVGPINDLPGGERMTWPATSSRRIFAYLRLAPTANNAILRDLKSAKAAVICFLPGVSPELKDELRTDSFQIASRPIHLAGIFDSANLCVSNAPAGTVTSALLKGVPQLMMPQHPEARLTAERVVTIGAGLAMSETPDESQTSPLLQRLLEDPSFKACACEFAQKYHGFDRAHAVDRIVQDIDQIAARPSKLGIPTAHAAR